MNIHPSIPPRVSNNVKPRTDNITIMLIVVAAAFSLFNMRANYTYSSIIRQSVGNCNIQFRNCRRTRKNKTIAFTF